MRELISYLSWNLQKDRHRRLWRINNSILNAFASSRRTWMHRHPAVRRPDVADWQTVERLRLRQTLLGPGQGQKVFNNHKLIANRQAAPRPPRRPVSPTYLHLPQRQHPGTCMWTSACNNFSCGPITQTARQRIPGNCRRLMYPDCL